MTKIKAFYFLQKTLFYCLLANYILTGLSSLDIQFLMMLIILLTSFALIRNTGILNTCFISNSFRALFASN